MKNITVECKIIGFTTSHKHDNIGEGTYKGTPFTLHRMFPSGSILMRYGGKSATVTMDDLGLAMLKAMEGD